MAPLAHSLQQAYISKEFSTPPQQQGLNGGSEEGLQQEKTSAENRTRHPSYSSYEVGTYGGKNPTPQQV